jgi:hypothetical protein
MPTSEIDDIFSGKASSSKVKEQPTKKSKKSKSKKRKHEDEKDSAPTLERPKKKSKQIVPEEIVDTSSSLGKSSKNLAKSKPEKKTKLAKNDAPFADSRGTSSLCLVHPLSRPFHVLLLGRTTEEGWAIYKEADLGIDPEQGGL